MSDSQRPNAPLLLGVLPSHFLLPSILEGRPLTFFYVAAMIALGFHLYHGAWSMFQSLGWNNPRFNAWRRYFATGLAGRPFRISGLTRWH